MHANHYLGLPLLVALWIGGSHQAQHTQEAQLNRAHPGWVETQAPAGHWAGEGDHYRAQLAGGRFTFGARGPEGLRLTWSFELLTVQRRVGATLDVGSLPPMPGREREILLRRGRGSSSATSSPTTASSRASCSRTPWRVSATSWCVGAWAEAHVYSVRTRPDSPSVGPGPTRSMSAP